MTAGRGFGEYRKGQAVTSIAELDTGALVLEYSPQFDAENTVFITRRTEDRAYGVFVSPDDWQERQGSEFCIWQHDICLGTLELWQAV